MAENLWSVKRASLKDREGVLELVERAADHAHQHLGSEEEHQQSLEEILEHYGRMLDLDRVWVVRFEQSIIGCGYLDLTHPVAQEKGCDAYMGGLYTAVAGLGIRDALNEVRLLAAGAAGCQLVLTEVAEANREAVERLRRLGFHVVGSHRGRDYAAALWLELVRELMPPPLQIVVE